MFSFPTLLAAATALPAPFAAQKTLPASSATLSPAILQSIQNLQTHKSTLAANAPWLTHLLAGCFVLCAVALVVLLAVQTTKQEGLTGSIGGRVESAYKTRLGFDQQLQRITSYVAIAFVFFALAVSLSGI